MTVEMRTESKVKMVTHKLPWTDAKGIHHPPDLDSSPVQPSQKEESQQAPLPGPSAEPDRLPSDGTYPATIHASRLDDGLNLTFEVETSEGKWLVDWFANLNLPKARNLLSAARRAAGLMSTADDLELEGKQVKVFCQTVNEHGVPRLKIRKVFAFSAPASIAGSTQPGQSKPMQGGNPRAPGANPWKEAQPVQQFLAGDDNEAEFIDKDRRVIARESITQVYAPRGLGKSEWATNMTIRLAPDGYRVLYLDRDNPPRITRARFRAWGAASLETDILKVLERNKVPPLTDSESWANFPWKEYDVVIIDSLDSHTEGTGEQYSDKPSKAIAPLLDIAHREGGPAVLILGNTVKSGKQSRGSGVIEDRADIVYEARDVTNWTPQDSERPWHEKLPDPGRASWASRATRRNRQDKIRLAFIPSKFRLGEEPDPFILEIDFSTNPRSLRDVTDEVDKAGAEARETARREQADKEGKAIDALRAEIGRRSEAGERPMRKREDAEPFLTRMGLRRQRARELLTARDRHDWRLERAKGEHGQAVLVLPLGINGDDGQKSTPLESAKIEAANDPVSGRPQNTARPQNDLPPNRMNGGSQESPLLAEVENRSSPSRDEPTPEVNIPNKAQDKKCSGQKEDTLEPAKTLSSNRPVFWPPYEQRTARNDPSNSNINKEDRETPFVAEPALEIHRTRPVELEGARISAPVAGRKSLDQRVEDSHETKTESREVDL